MLKKIFLVLLAVFVVIQLIPTDRTNPPVTADLEADDEVAALFRRACYDCHSHETEWPWYGYVAPVSWWLVDHVNHARSHLNFSEWENYPPKKKKHKLEEIIEEVDAEKMPLPSYLIIHRDAGVSEADFTTLKRWVESESSKMEIAEEGE